MTTSDFSPQFENEILKLIPTRGWYSAVGRKGGMADVVWSHGVSEKVLIQFLPPRTACRIADDLNFVHVDERTGDTVRNWEQLKIAWWTGKPEPSRLILPFSR